MDCGKSTLALQIDHNQARQGRRGLLLVRHDRSGPARISSRLGLARAAIEVTDRMDLRELVAARVAAGARVDYLVVDEAQFLDPDQVEQLADLVDGASVDVYAFGISTDFRGRLFPGSQRLLELADVGAAAAGRGAVLVRAAGPAQRQGGRRPGRAGRRHRARRRHRRRGRGALPGALPAPTTAAATSGRACGRPGNSRSVKSSLRTATSWACRPSFRAGVHAG